MRVIEANRLIQRIMNNEIHMNRNPNIYTSLITEDLIFDAVPVRHGRWLNKRYGVEFDGKRYPFRTIATCSECNETSCDAGNYCPNCGAKMDAKEEDLTAVGTASQWIPCGEKFPEDDELVLGCTKDGFILMMYFRTWWDDYDHTSTTKFVTYEKEDLFDIDDIVAWMPLPNLYEAERKEE